MMHDASGLTTSWLREWFAVESVVDAAALASNVGVGVAVDAAARAGSAASGSGGKPPKSGGAWPRQLASEAADGEDTGGRRSDVAAGAGVTVSGDDDDGADDAGGLGPAASGTVPAALGTAVLPPARGSAWPCGPGGRISQGTQQRSADGKRWASMTLTELMSITLSPVAEPLVDELLEPSLRPFDSKAVRDRGGPPFASLVATLKAVVTASRSLVLHYGSWREAFAVFQAALFRRDGPPAATARQERLRGVVDDLVLDCIQYTTEHFVSTRMDSPAPTVLKPTPPFKSALEAAPDLLIMFFKDFAAGVVWILADDLGHLLSDIQPCPLGAVPKKDPGLDIPTGENRTIHAHNAGGAVPVNDLTHRVRHPPAFCPYHSEVALYLVWLAVNLPRLRQGEAKFDIRSAFRQRLVHLSDANWFAANWPGVRSGSGC